MSGDSLDLRDWIDRQETAEDVCDPRRVADMAATLDLDAAPGTGDRLPPGWHWMFFNPMVRARDLGPDGHPRRGGFLPRRGSCPSSRNPGAPGRWSSSSCAIACAPARRHA